MLKRILSLLLVFAMLTELLPAVAVRAEEENSAVTVETTAPAETEIPETTLPEETTIPPETTMPVETTGPVETTADEASTVPQVTEVPAAEAETTEPVTEPPVTDVALSLLSLPDQLFYLMDDELDLTGLALTVRDSLGNTRTVGPEDGVAVIAGDTARVGKYPIMVEYGGLTAEFDIYVHETGIRGEILQDASGYPASPHPYPNNSQNYVYTVPGAKYLKMTFSSLTEVENRYDNIYLYDGNNVQQGGYTSTNLAGKTVTIPGDTVQISLTTDGTVNKYGFSLDSVYAYLDEAQHEPADEGVYTMPLCFEDGWYTHTCWICGESFVEPDEDSAGHTYSGGSCVRCGLPEGLTDSAPLSDTLTWGITAEKILYISGTGAIPEDPDWDARIAGAEVLVISEGITSIGKNAFQNQKVMKSVSFPTTLQSIGNYAFSGCTGLTALTLPEGLTTLGTYAFDGCTGIAGQLVIPESLTKIGNYAFRKCTSLTSLAFHDNITSIGNYAFDGCTGLTGTLTLPVGLKSLGIYVFRNCSGVTGKLVIPEAVPRLDMGVFSGMTGITSLVIGSGVQYISTNSSSAASNALFNMPAVKEVTFLRTAVSEPTDVYSPFQWMTKLETVWVPALALGAYTEAYQSYLPGNARIRAEGADEFCIVDGVLISYQGTGGDVVIPQGVEIIGTSAFQNCKTMTSVSIPDTVTQIGAYAFRNCTGLTELNLPDSIVSIGDNAFDNCLALASVDLSQSLTSIGAYAFRDNDALTAITLPDGMETLGTGGFQSCGLLEQVDLGESLTAIADYSFNNCIKLTGIVIPDTVVSIGNYAFYGCSVMTELTLGSNLQTIGTSAFYGCSRILGQLQLPEGLTSIGASAFYNCSKFTGTLVLPQKLTYLGESAFYNCKGFTGELVVPNGVQTLPKRVFGNMTGITSLVIGTGVTSIYSYSTTNYPEYNAFYNLKSVTEVTFLSTTVPALVYQTTPFVQMTSLEKVLVPGEAYTAYSTAYSSYLPANVRLQIIGADDDFAIQDGVLLSYLGQGGDVEIPQGVTAIGDSAFQNCTTLTGVVIPEGVVEIGDYAFDGCTALTTMNLPESLERIGAYAFSECAALAIDLMIPNAVTEISERAFYKCSSMTSLVIGSGVTTIGNYAFYDCSSLSGTLTLPESMTSIGTYAFYGCKNLTGELVVPNGIAKLDTAVFSGMSGITSLVLGTGVTSVCTNSGGYQSNNAFYGMTSVTEVTFLNPTAPSLTYDSTPFYNMTSLQRIYVPAEGFASYAQKFQSYLTANVRLMTTESEEFLIRNGVLLCYQGDAAAVEIPAGVTAIGSMAFFNCTGVRSVTIPEDVTTVGSYAFKGCTNLESVTFPESLSVLDNYAFSGCSALADMILPEGLTAIGNYAFQDARSLTAVTIPSGVATVGNYAFHNCSGLQEVTFREGLQKIGSYAFYGCTALQSLSFPETLTNIGADAFDGCTGLTGDLRIPASVSAIGNYAFRAGGKYSGAAGKLTIAAGGGSIGSSAFYESGFTSLEFEEGITSIDSSAFYGCTKLTGDLVLPDSVKTIGKTAFYGCSSLDGKLVLPASVTTIGNSAFRNCGKISGELVIPDSVTKLGESVFASMPGVTSIVVGNGMQDIYTYYNSGSASYNYYHAFYNMTGVLEVTFTGKVPPTKGTNAYACSLFRYMTSLQRVNVPAEYYDAYVDAYRQDLPDTVRIGISGVEDFWIENGVLISYQGMGGEVVIPGGITSIGSSAFRGCTALTKVVIPEGVTRIEEDAFRGCGNLAEVSLPESLKKIGQYAFYGCTAITELTFKRGLQAIDPYAFANCTGLSGGLSIPDGTLVGSHAFAGCTGLDGVLRVGGETVGDYAFQGCTGLTGLELAEGIRAIGNYAFDGCAGLTGDLVIPDTVESIGHYAFQGCAGFDGSLVLPAALTSLGQFTFYNCSGFTGELILPDGVKALNTGVFSKMSGITTLILGTGLEYIYTYYKDYTHALYGMTGLKEIAFNSLTVPSIDRYTPFPEMTSLETIFVPAAAYDAYVAAYGGFVGENVVFSSDFLKAKVPGFRVEALSSHRAVLAWNPHTSQRVTHYRILRDGVFLAETEDVTFTDRGLETGVTYTYQVFGCASDGDLSSAAELTLTPAAPRPMDISVNNAENKIGLNRNTIYLHAADTGNLVPIDGREPVAMLYRQENDAWIPIGQASRDTSLGSSRSGVFTFDWDVSVMDDGEYTLLFRLTDADGVSGDYTETVVLDRTVPAKILDVTAISDISVLYLTWDISAEADTGIYRIYRRSEIEEDFRLLAQINDRNTLRYIDASVRKDRIYYYYVVGVNSFGNEGIPSDIAGATLASDEREPIVTKLTPGDSSVISGSTVFTLESQDNVAVTEAQLYWAPEGEDSWTLFGQGSSPVLRANLDTKAIPDGPVRVRALVRDAAGNESTPVTYTYSIDNTGPEQVTGLAYVCTSVTATIRWKNVSDADIHHFLLERKESDATYSLVATVTGTLGYNLYNLLPDTLYTFRVVGYDACGNRGIPSEDLNVLTVSDVTAPVVTRIRPTSGYFSSVIPVTATAEDDSTVEKMILQTSADGQRWTDVHVRSFTDISRTRSMSFDLQLSAFPEGLLYVRILAEDASGNRSNSGADAPFVQHMVDRTAPAVPENVRAEGSCGYVEISWTQGREQDLNTYSIWRADKESGTYVCLASGIAALNFFDRTAPTDRDVFYKVRVNDNAGNESLFCAPVSARALADTEKPRIQSVYPTDGSAIGAGFRTLNILAADNSAVASLRVQYSIGDAPFALLKTFSELGEHYANVRCELPVDSLSHGDTIRVRIQPEDIAGNTGDAVVYTYVMDALAPIVRSASAAFADNHVTISWTGNEEPDLSCYRIYRKTGSSGTYTLFAQRAAVAGQQDYLCYDGDLEDGEVTYYYKVEAVDRCGNTSAILAEVTGGADNALQLPDRSAPVPVLSLETTQEVDVEYTYDASESTDNTAIVSYLMDFGDGCTATDATGKHIYKETGTYTASLIVTDADGHRSTLTREITVLDRTAIGTAKIRVVDENGTAVAGAMVYFDLGEEYQSFKKTDASGWASFTASVGKHSVGCIISDNQWLPGGRDVIITAGAETSVIMTMVKRPLVTGTFDVQKMTFEEIEAAGIDISDPENQHIVKINVQLTYTNSENQVLDFHYNVVNGQIVGGEEDFGGEFIVDGGDYGPVKLIPGILATDDGDMPTAVAILELPMEASMLKEFFHVKLHIMNNASGEFSMVDNVVTLEIPDGLSLMDSAYSSASPVFRIPEIPGGETETAHWILRGDEEGDYHLRADYVGTLAQFNRTVRTTFETKEPLQVRGLSGLKLLVEADPEITYDEFYFNLVLENTGTTDVNLPNIHVAEDVITAYLRRVSEENSYIHSSQEPEVELLQHLLSAGDETTLVEGTLTTLKPGQKSVKKYVVRGATGYGDPLFFKEALFEIAEGYGIAAEYAEIPLEDSFPVFDYREDVPHRRLAEELSLYALLAQGGSVRNNNGIWVEGNGSNSLAQQLKRDGYLDISRTGDLVLAHRTVFDGETAADQLLAVFTGEDPYEGFDITGNGYDPDAVIHSGFAAAADAALTEIAAYIRSHGAAGAMDAADVRILLTGHGNGAAAANLAAKHLTDIRSGLADARYKEIGIGGVLAYTFATPNVATADRIRNPASFGDAREKTLYDNIFNFCFTDDLAANLPLETWSWGKFGKTYWATAADLAQSSAAFAAAVRTYRGGRQTEYDSGLTGNIVATLERAVGQTLQHYYTKGFAFQWPETMTMHLFLRNGLGGAMAGSTEGISILRSAAAPDPMGYTSGYFRSLALDITDGGRLNAALENAHHARTYYTAMRAGYDVFCYDPLTESGYLATSTPAANSAAAVIDPDPEQAEVFRSFLLQQITDETTGKTLSNHELLTWDPEDPASWTGITWENGNVVALDLRYSGVFGSLDLTAFPALTQVDVSYCNLHELTVSDSLVRLNCAGNLLTALDLSGSSRLVSVNCAGNALTELTLTGCTALETLDCSGNALTALDVTACSGLQTLICHSNFLDPALGQQRIPAGAVFAEADVARLLAIANTGANLEILGWEMDKPETWTQITWTSVDGVWHLLGVDLTDLELSGEAVFDGCAYLQYLILPGNRFAALSVADCPALDTLWCERNFLDADVLEALAEERGLSNVKTRPQRADRILDPTDVAALDALVQAQNLDWESSLYASSEALTWTETDTGWILMAMNLTGLELSGSLDLSAFRNLQSLNCAGRRMEEVILPASLTVLPEGAFRGCAKLRRVEFTGDLPEIGEAAFRDVTATAVYPFDNETWTADALDQYGGSITWLASVYVSVTGSTTIRGGTTVTLEAAIRPENKTGTALLWELEPGAEAYLTLTVSKNTAKLKAKAVDIQRTFRLRVSPADGSAQPADVQIVLCPSAELVRIYNGAQDVTGQNLNYDISRGDLLLQAKSLPEDAIQGITWTTSNRKVAEVQDGTVTFTGTAGTVRITATAADGSKKKADVTIQALNVPKDLLKTDDVPGDADLAIVGGKSMDLKVTDNATGKPLTAKQITWTMDKRYAAFATVTAAGKLKTQKVVSWQQIEVCGTVTGSIGEPIVYVIDIYPAATQVEITNAQGEVLNGQTISVKDAITLTPDVWPADALQGIDWGKLTNNYADCTVNPDGSLTVRRKKDGRAGTLTLKATATDGSKKSAQVKLRFGILAEDLTILEPESRVLAGGSLTLKTEVTASGKLSTPGITWWLSKEDSAYASVSGGKVTARNVTEPHTVTVHAETKDGCAWDSIELQILPKAEKTLVLKSGEDYLTGRTKALDSVEETTLTLSARLLTRQGEAPEAVSWTTSSDKVASLSVDKETKADTVTVTLHKAGSATITAKDASGRTAKVTVKGSVLVKNLTVTVKESWNMTPNGIEVASGKSINLVATANADASNKKVTWTMVKGDEFAAITASGKLTAVKDLTTSHTVTVQATAADGSGVQTEPVTVTVRPVAQGLQVFALEKGVQTSMVRSGPWWARSSTTVQWDLTSQGDEIPMYAQVYPFYAEDPDRCAMQTMSWKSSAPKIADFKIVEGQRVLKIKGTGTTTITVTAEDGSKQKVSFKLTVVRNVQTLDLDAQELASGKSVNLAKLLKPTPTDTTTKKFQWSVTGGDGMAYVTLSASGTLKAKTVTTEKTVEVTVTALDDLGCSEKFQIRLVPVSK